MSVMDFSAMFKVGGDGTGEETDDHSYNGELIFNQSTAFMVVEGGDPSAWIVNNIRSLNLECEESEITPKMTIVLQRLFQEVKDFNAVDSCSSSLLLQ